MNSGFANFRKWWQLRTRAGRHLCSGHVSTRPKKTEAGKMLARLSPRHGHQQSCCLDPDGIRMVQQGNEDLGWSTRDGGISGYSWRLFWKMQQRGTLVIPACFNLKSVFNGSQITRRVPGINSLVKFARLSLAEELRSQVAWDYICHIRGWLSTRRFGYTSQNPRGAERRC